MEVGASRGNIDDLEVQSPSGTVGWQFRVRGQTIGSTASHDQRPAFVFKIQQRMVSVTGIDIHGRTSLDKNFYK